MTDTSKKLVDEAETDGGEASDVRMQFRVPPHVKKWLEKQARDLGFTSPGAMFRQHFVTEFKKSEGG